MISFKGAQFPKEVILFAVFFYVDLPCFGGERLAHFLGLSLEGVGALEAEG